MRGKAIQTFDQAGVLSSAEYDFKGNPLSTRRQFAQEYKSTLDWSSGPPSLEPEGYVSRTRYDALNRATRLIAPHSDQPGAAVNVVEPVYNPANLLDRQYAWLNRDAEPEGVLDPAAATLHAIVKIDYDARSRRKRIEFGNGAVSAYEYDPLTFRLTHLHTTRALDAAVLQDLRYTYDPSGNITHISDDAQQAVYFSNQCVEPDAYYTYDAVYRLIEATGREHLGQQGAPAPHSYDDAPRTGLLHPNDGQAMGRYVERYIYDAAGNFGEIRHRGNGPAGPGWTRSYAYEAPSLLDIDLPDRPTSNRLTSTTVSGSQSLNEAYSYDGHGNMLQMPHLQLMT